MAMVSRGGCHGSNTRWLLQQSNMLRLEARDNARAAKENVDTSIQSLSSEVRMHWVIY